MVRRYGLIGYPLGHSFSQDFFTKKFYQEGIEASYDLFQISSISDLPSLIDEVPTLVGLNVTIPYKRAVIPLLDKMDDGAKDIGAVNVVKIEKVNGKRMLIGFNSDAPAFRSSLQSLNLTRVNKALILGNGGASDAVGYALSNLEIEWRKVSRTPDDTQFKYDQLTNEVINRFQLVINTTPVGMFPEVASILPFPFHYLSSEHICYDLIYNPSVTSFMRNACQNGAWVKNGLEMLHKQAEISWNLWNP